MPIELKKEGVLSLAKTAEQVLRTKGLDGRKVQVKATIDISLSMQEMFRDGTVQNVIARTLALAIPFDDNGSVDVSLFGTNHYSCASVEIGNIEGYVQREIMSRHRINEGTCYAPPLRAMLGELKGEGKGVLGKFFGRKKPSMLPTFMLFYTDGNNSDRHETESVIRELSSLPAFVQFVGIGPGPFPFLKKLDELDGRIVDNAGFMHVGDINAISDDELYNRVLNEFPQYLRIAASAGIVV